MVLALSDFDFPLNTIQARPFIIICFLACIRSNIGVKNAYEWATKFEYVSERTGTIKGNKTDLVLKLSDHYRKEFLNFTSYEEKEDGIYIKYRQTEFKYTNSEGALKKECPQQSTCIWKPVEICLSR